MVREEMTLFWGSPRSEQILIGGAGNDVVVYADGQNNGHRATLLGDAAAQAAGTDGSDTLVFVGTLVATVKPVRCQRPDHW